MDNWPLPFGSVELLGDRDKLHRREQFFPCLGYHLLWSYRRDGKQEQNNKEFIYWAKKRHCPSNGFPCKPSGRGSVYLWPSRSRETNASQKETGYFQTATDPLVPSEANGSEVLLWVTAIHSNSQCIQIPS